MSDERTQDIWEFAEARKRRAQLKAVVDAALPIRDWYGLPLIYRAEHAALCDALDKWEEAKEE